jgi:hypothetical protein
VGMFALLSHLRKQLTGLAYSTVCLRLEVRD